ncbi:MAG: glycosyltransferase family 4 protein [Chthoniobacterales bacterium]
MKITIVTGAFLPVPPIMGGAVEKAWFALAREFARRGHEMVFVSRKLPALAREEVVDGIRHIRVRGFDTPRSLLWLKFLDLLYSRRTMSMLPEADILVTNTFWLPLLLRDARRGEIYVHVGRFPKGQMRFYRRAARLQAPSHVVANAIKAEAPQLSSKVAVIPYPVTRSRAETPPPSIEERAKTILFVGRVHPEKGVHLLVEAFAKKARTVFADWEMMIVGPVDEKFGGGGEAYAGMLKRMAQAARGKVIFRGAVFNPAALEHEFRSAKVFVYPSLAEKGEAFGLAPLEAMAQRCAVLVSNLDCFRDFICDGETGFVFDHRGPQPIAALGDKLEQVIVDHALVARVAQAGHRKAAEYSVASVADQFLGDFDSVASHG